jgi:hypothetical protein
MKSCYSVLLIASLGVDAFTSTTPHHYKRMSFHGQQQRASVPSMPSMPSMSSNEYTPMSMSMSSNGGTSQRILNRIKLKINNRSASASAASASKSKSKSAIESTTMDSNNFPSPSSSSLSYKLKQILNLNLNSILQNTIHKLKNLNDVGKWRLAATAFLTSIYTFSPQIDTQLIKIWSWLSHSNALLPTCFRHDHWEWMVAIWAFFFYIHGYWLVDRSIAKADKVGIVHRWKKYRLQDEFEGEKFRRMQLRRLERNNNGDNNSISISGVGSEDTTMNVENNNNNNNNKRNIENTKEMNMETKPPVTKQHKWHLGFWIFELPLYVLPLFIWDICIPRRAAKLALWNAPSTYQICKDVTCGLLLYDLGFFVCHYLMHKVPFLYKYVHAKHHTSTEVRASDIVRYVLYFIYM